MLLGLAAAPASHAAAPVISGLSAGSAPPGGRLRITRRGFGDLPGTSCVEIGALPAFTTRWSEVSITTYVPGWAPTGSTHNSCGGALDDLYLIRQ